MPTRYGHTNLIARDWRRLGNIVELQAWSSAT
jgi:hypothetical protein